MKKLIFGLGILTAGLLIFNFHSGEIGTSDVMDMMGEIGPLGLSEENNGNVETGDELIPEIAGEDKLKAVILPYDEELNEFFEELSASGQNIERFFVIGRNVQNQGKYKIALSKKDYDVEGLLFKVDKEIVDEILKIGDEEENMSLGISYRTFAGQNSVSVIVPYIEMNFSGAEIVPVMVSDAISVKDMDRFASIMEEVVDEKTLVVFSTDFAPEMEDLVAQFHKELTEDVIESFDLDGIWQVDVDGNAGLYVLMKYLEGVEARKTEFDGGIVRFYEGEAVSSDRNLTIMAFGDMMLGRYVRTLMNENGLDYIFENISGYENRFFGGADYIFGNLEGPIDGQGKSGGTAMVFSFNEDIAPFLKKFGFNLFTLANNHAVDQGWDGRDSTIAALEGAGIDWCGHPSEVDSGSVFYDNVGEKKVAFFCFHDVTFKLDDEAAQALIKQVSPYVDYLIVSIHWGQEYQNRPDWGSQIEPGRAFVDAGADFVIGHHPHVVQSFEIYNGKFIFYSLGNFVFDQYWAQMTQEELGIGIVLDDGDSDEESLRTKVYLFPMKSEMSQSRFMTEEERNEWIETFISYGEYSEEMKEMIRNGVVEN